MVDFLSLLERGGVVIYDGATGTHLQTLNLGPDDFGGPAFEGCNELLVMTRPEAIADMHRLYFEAGADVTETNTFGAFAVPLGEYGIAHRCYEINAHAAQLARGVADEFTTRTPPDPGRSPDRSGRARSSPRWARSPTHCSRWAASTAATYEAQLRRSVERVATLTAVEVHPEHVGESLNVEAGADGALRVHAQETQRTGIA